MSNHTEEKNPEILADKTSGKEEPPVPIQELHIEPAKEEKPESIVKSSKSTRWTNENDPLISHPELVNSKKLPKVVIWKDLMVWVPVQNKGWFKKRISNMRCILKGVSGVAEPGQILAIMGSSGAGKTSLLNVLTQRFKKTLRIEGEINVNGEILRPSAMRQASAFVQQFDLFLGSQTVREHLLFCAHLRMGREISNADKVAKVDEVIAKMGLKNCQDTIIGQRHTKSISLGEKKRLSFAAELLNDPSIIFCDEPTSGLDAYMAKQVISCLKQLAKEDGCTIIITIHQPSSQIFEMIDRVCFMANGKVCYLGPTKKVPAFFGSIGYQMPIYTNPSEFAIKCLAIQEGENEEEYCERIDDISRTYTSSALAQDFRIRTHGPVSERRILANEDIRNVSRYNSSWFTQFWWLFKRAFWRAIRDPLMIKIRVVHTVLTAVFISMLYWKTYIKSDTIINADGLMYNAVRDSFHTYMFPSILVFTEELPVFTRESHARIYRTDAYFIAKSLAELPQYMILPFIYTTIIFFTTGVMDSPDQYKLFKWPVFVLIGTITTSHALSIGYAAACIFALPEIAVQYIPMMNLPLLAMSGFFIKLNSINPGLRWLSHVSWYRYAFEAFMINVWYDRGSIEGCNASVTNIVCSGSNGTEHLTQVGLSSDYSQIWVDIAILFGMACVVRAIALGALMIRNRLTDG